MYPWAQVPCSVPPVVQGKAFSTSHPPPHHGEDLPWAPTLTASRCPRATERPMARGAEPPRSRRRRSVVANTHSTNCRVPMISMPRPWPEFTPGASCGDRAIRSHEHGRLRACVPGPLATQDQVLGTRGLQRPSLGTHRAGDHSQALASPTSCLLGLGHCCPIDRCSIRGPRDHRQGISPAMWEAIVARHLWELGRK